MTVNANKKRKHKNKTVDDNYGHVCPSVLGVVVVVVIILNCQSFDRHASVQ